MRLAQLRRSPVRVLLVQISVLGILYAMVLGWALIFQVAVQPYLIQMVLLYVGFAVLTVVFGRSVVEYLPLLLILHFGMLVWTYVFNAAVVDYLSGGLWNGRGVWLGDGPTNLFGYTINMQLEGYTDYSFFYVHWGHNMLNGVMPYSDAFGYISINGIVNKNGLYIFPPLYAYLYAAGIALPVDDWGIGLLIAILGYLTALPVYGLARELSSNRHIAEAATLTYLLSPSILYHIDYVWLNPSPFIFFFFAGFYMLVRGRRHTGTILIVTAALFKQTAWFLGIPLIVYLLVKPRSVEEAAPTVHRGLGQAVGAALRKIPKSLDVRGFMFSVVVVVIFIAAVMFPFLIAQPNALFFMSLASGGFRLESFTDAPYYGSPMRLQVLPLIAYLSLPVSDRTLPIGVFFLWLTQVLDAVVYYGFLLYFGVVLFAGLMLMEPRRPGHERKYVRRILFLTMLMMLWVNLVGPRGVYKYYFTLFAPFFSFFSSARIVESRDEHVPFSWSMLWLPISMTLLILIPSRNVYLFAVLLILVGYLLVHHVGTFWFLLTAPGRYVSGKARRRARPVVLRVSLLVAKLRRSSGRTGPSMDTRRDLAATQKREATRQGGSRDV